RRARTVDSTEETQVVSSGPSSAQIARVEDILQRQDAQGRWVSDKLYIRDFVRNMNALCAYLERVNPN
ncbi:hypothetical protein MK163_10600, partial [bacterium]|nr:hypothetical protein [bacterium]